MAGGHWTVGIAWRVRVVSRHMVRARQFRIGAVAVAAMLTVGGAGTLVSQSVPVAAEVIGVSRATLYTAVKTGQAPVRTIKVLGRIKVVTESVIALLEGRPDVLTGQLGKPKGAA